MSIANVIAGRTGHDGTVAASDGPRGRAGRGAGSSPRNTSSGFWRSTRTPLSRFGRGLWACRQPDLPLLPIACALRWIVLFAGVGAAVGCSNCGGRSAKGVPCAFCGHEEDASPSGKEAFSRYCKTHGNLFEFLCPVCQTQELCSACDVIRSDWQVNGLGYGYLLARGLKHESSPLLYKEDILPQLT
jgi:hypothetical protein